MLLNYLKLSLRLLLRSPFLTFINLAGLSVGFAAFYILWPYAQTELNSDKFHQDFKQIARLSWHHRWTDNNQDWNEFFHALNFCGVGRRIADEFSEVKEYTRYIAQKDFRKDFFGVDSKVFFTTYKNDSTKEFFREDNTAFGDPNFFGFFSFPLKSGDPATVLSQPRSVVISEKYSIKYFGTTNSLNAILHLNDSIPLRVTGVFKDLPQATHLKFDLLMSTAGIDEVDLYFRSGYDVFNTIGANYIKVNKGVDFSGLERRIHERRKELYDHWENTDPTVLVQPLENIVFTEFIDNPFTYKSKNALLILRVLAFIVLFLAWTNYLSLSITTLHKRLPEVGTRKVVGAGNRDLIFQFLVESAIVNGIAILLALSFVQLVKTPIEYLFHFYVVNWEEIVKHHLTVIILIPASGIAIIGLYAVLISAKKGAAELLKKLRSIQQPWWIKCMITVQYASAMVLLIWVGAVYFQLDYILHKNKGITQGGIIVVDCPIGQQSGNNHPLDHFIHESRTINGVKNASISKSVPGDQTGFPFFIKRNENAITIGLFSNGVVDENFLDLYGIRLLEGRNFHTNNPADKTAVLISLATSKRLGYPSPADCIGEKIILPTYHINNVEIIGVYEDYYFEPYFVQAQAKGQGSILTYKNSLAPDIPPSKISLKIDLGHVTSTIATLENLYKSSFPRETFNWTFLDQNINRHYAQEQIVRNQIMLFTLLAIGVACLGLLGTTSSKVVEKTKEIGIRKVLGAGVRQIAQILINTTVRQMIIATIIGIPIAYYLVLEYLERYTEQLHFQWWHYAVPVALLLLIMFVTIAGVLLKAAGTNPVESLRSE